MNINPKAKAVHGNSMVRNREGATLWKDNPYRTAILSGMTLSLRPRRSFYYSDIDEFNNFIDTLKELYSKDPEFLEALIPYLRLEHGRKLSPMVTMGFLLAQLQIEKKDSQKQNPTELKHIHRFINARIVDTPKRMAEVFATYKMLSGEKSFSTIPYKEHFKKTLESYSEYTLKKNRMRRRAIKLADLIKVLRPKPKDDNMSALCKAIIENDKLASLKEDEHVTATLSSTNLSQKEKIQILEQSIDKMPFNALLRNISQFADSSLEVKLQIRDRLRKDILDGGSRVFAVVNPFDLLALPRSSKWENMGALQDAVADVFNAYIDYWAEKLHTQDKKAALLLDVSSSMYGIGFENTASFIAVISRIYNIYTIGAFDHKLYLMEKYTALQKFKDTIHNTKDTFKLAMKLDNTFKHHLIGGGGTALVDSYRKFTKAASDADIYIVISDEVTWADKDHATWELEFLPNKDKQKIMIFNPAYMGRRGGVVIKSPQLLRLSGLTPGLLPYLEMWDGDIMSIVKYIKEKYLYRAQSA